MGPGILVYYRREVLSSGVGSVESRQESHKDEEAHELNEKIIESLRCLAAEWRLLGAGLYVGTGLRQDIPLELWANAKFEFGSGRIISGKFEYNAVTLWEPEISPAEDDLETAIRNWLSDRRDRHGEEKKHTLQDDARNKFGESFTVRVFNAAYSGVYKRKRGRPETKKK